MSDQIKQLQNQCDDNSERIDHLGEDISQLFSIIEELQKDNYALKAEIKKIKNAQITLQLDLEG